MPKLYYTPTSCGAASFIAAHTAGLKLDCETVDLGSHKTASGADFYAANPKGNVPALVLDDGTCLNEGAAVLQWIADQARRGAPAPVACPLRSRARFGRIRHRACSLMRRRRGRTRGGGRATSRHSALHRNCLRKRATQVCTEPRAANISRFSVAREHGACSTRGAAPRCASRRPTARG